MKSRTKRYNIVVSQIFNSTVIQLQKLLNYSNKVKRALLINLTRLFIGRRYWRSACATITNGGIEDEAGARKRDKGTVTNVWRLAFDQKDVIVASTARTWSRR